MGSNPVQWNAEAIWEAVFPLLPSFTIEILPEIDSTNTELMRRARAGQLEPSLLVAERQTAGRGRVGRTWLGAAEGESPALTFSLGLPLAPPDWSGLSLAVGLAVVSSLHPDLRLKWPNDIWLQQRKLGGILIETVSVGVVRYAVIGVGINISMPAANDLRTPPAALHELLPDAQAAEVLGRVVLPLVQQVQRFASEGFAPLRAAFHARDMLYGNEVVCSDGMTGTARGVDANGALLVHTAQGLKKISSAEVSVRPQAGSRASSL
ncbi:MAG: biotin--[acetyl-CoA-carboxylase] ligase [Rhodoferax sp.]|nr:biotin--[acetyl-CoA-carboxylase] ligase [Rhodoferax sp.]